VNGESQEWTSDLHRRWLFSTHKNGTLRASVDRYAKRCCLHASDSSKVAGLCNCRYSDAGARCGANTAIFSVIKSVLLSPLPYGTPERLMAVSQGDARTQMPGTTSFGTLVEWRGRTRLFDSLVAYRDWVCR